MNLVSGSHSIDQNLYHLEWYPKYRYNICYSERKIKKLYENVLHQITKQHNREITELCVMPDHIHTVVGIPPTMSVSKVLQFLKGISSGELFKKITFLMQIWILYSSTLEINDSNKTSPPSQ